MAKWALFSYRRMCKIWWVLVVISIISVFIYFDRFAQLTPPKPTPFIQHYIDTNNTHIVSKYNTTSPNNTNKDITSTNNNKDITPTNNNKDIPPTNNNKDITLTNNNKDITSTNNNKDIPPTNNNKDITPTNNNKDITPTNNNKDIPPCHFDINSIMPRVPGYRMLHGNHFNRRKASIFQQFLHNGEIDSNLMLQVKDGRLKWSNKWMQHFLDSVAKPIPETTLPPTETLLRPESFSVCAVVGNSGILNGRGCGSEIDSADFVFRSNLAPTRKYAHDVGLRTDFMTMNPSMFRLYFNKLQSSEGVSKLVETIQESVNASVWITGHPEQYKQLLKDKMDEARSNSSMKIPDIFISPYNFHESISTSWKKLFPAVKKKNRMTTGVVLLSFALGICEDIRLYGFYPYDVDSDGVSVPYHYYTIDNITLIKHSWNHDFDLEHRILLFLHSQGVFTMRQECTEDPLTELRKSKPYTQYNNTDYFERYATCLVT